MFFNEKMALYFNTSRKPFLNAMMVDIQILPLGGKYQQYCVCMFCFK